MADRREPWTIRWGRRLVTIPAVVCASTLWLALLPLLLPVAAAIDVVTGRRLARARAVLVVLIYLLCECAGVGAAVGVGAVLLGGRLGGPGRYQAWNAALQRVWSSALFWGTVRVYGIRVERQGLTAPLRGPVLMLVRHTSTADTVLAAALITNPSRLVLRYVLKRELLWDPCLDLVGHRLPNAFVRRGTGAEAELAAVADLGRGLDDRSGVLIYPEGTRFTAARRERAIAGLRERGSPLADRAAGLVHVLPPKTAGTLALLDAAPDADVILVAHTGFEGATSLRDLWRGALVGQTLAVRVTRIPRAAVPAVDREAWLYDRWSELDAWVDAHRARQDPA